MSTYLHKRSRGRPLLLTLALVLGLALPGVPAGAAATTTLGAVTGFSPDQAKGTFTLDAGKAKVKVVFLADDVFRLWLAPDGVFTDPANTPPTDPAAPASNIVVKNDYAVPSVQWSDAGAYYSLRTKSAEVRAYKKALRFGLYRPDGSRIWEEQKGLSWTGTATTQELSRGPAEQFLGGGMQNGRFSHRDQTIKVSQDENWEDGGNPNASPYYMSSAGYGVLRNTFTPGTYSFKSPVSTTQDEKRFDAYYFVGDFKNSLNRYTELTGRPFLPPMYGMEYGDSDCYNRGHYGVDPDPKNDYKNQPDKQTTLDAVKVAQKFEDEDMPHGWMLVNDDYGCGYSANLDYEYNQDRKAYTGVRDINALTKTGDELRRRNTEMGLWTEQKLDKQADEVGKAGVRIRKLDVAWVGPGYRHALSGCDDAYNGIQQHSDARGFAWMVEGWAGAQRCAVQWTGDHAGSLDAIKWQIPAVAGSGNSGIAYSAGDIDGIFGGSDVSYVRDLQWKVFNPALMSMSGWANPTSKQPWSRGEPYTAINRNYLKLRERLLPFLYSYAAQAHKTGLPIDRSVALEYPNDPKAYDDSTKYEFLAGQEFLVAPMFDAGEVKNGIYLPAGTWTDYWTGHTYQGPTTVDGYHAPLDRLPLFVKAGAVVPMFRDGINSEKEQKPGDRVTVDVYPQGYSSFTMYEDDRATRAYQQGKSAEQRFDVLAPDHARGDVTVRIGESRGNYAGKPANRPYELTVHTGTAPGGVRTDSGALPQLRTKAEYDAAQTGWYYAAEDRGGVVSVKTAAVPTGRSASVTLARTSSLGGGDRLGDTQGKPALATPKLWNGPDQATEVSASFRNDTASVTQNVRLSLGLPAGFTARPQSADTFTRVRPGETVSTKFDVTPGAAVKPGSYTVRLDTAYTARGAGYTNSTVATASIPFASIAQAYNTVGVADSTTYGKGNFDGSGNSFPAEALAAAGYKPGAPVTADGVQFQWPSAAPGTPNVAKGQGGQPVLLSGTGSSVTFLASGASTQAAGDVVAMYTDGTESTAKLTVPNWSFQDATTGGSKLAVAVKGRYTPGGLANTDVDYRVFTNSVPLTPGKTLRAIRLPSSATIGVFAMTVT